VPQPLPRFDREAMPAEQAATLDRILAEVGDEAPASAPGATPAGDVRRLRGIPAHSRRTPGAIAGTDPVRALLAKGVATEEC
jgi:hypothetical protein